MNDDVSKSWLERITDWRSARDRVIGFAAAVFRLEAIVRKLVESQTTLQTTLEKQGESHRKALEDLEARHEQRLATLRQAHQAELEALRKDTLSLRETVKFIEGQQDIIRSLLDRDRRT